MKMYIKTQDTVSIITGKDRGKAGKVIQVLPKDGMVVVEGVNKMYKYLRSQKRGEKGQRVEFFGPLLTSKVMLQCPKCMRKTRVSITRTAGKRTRVCKKCKEPID